MAEKYRALVGITIDATEGESERIRLEAGDEISGLHESDVESLLQMSAIELVVDPAAEKKPTKRGKK